MLTKIEKNRVVILAEKGLGYLDITEDIQISRVPKLFVDLSIEINSYLWKLEEKEEGVKNDKNTK